MNTVVAIMSGIVVLALIGCVAVLAWHGTVDGQAAIGFFSTVTISGVVGTATHVAHRAGAKAALTRERGTSL